MKNRLVVQFVLLMERWGAIRHSFFDARRIYEQHHGRPRFNRDIAMFEAVEWSLASTGDFKQAMQRFKEEPGRLDPAVAEEIKRWLGRWATEAQPTKPRRLRHKLGHT